MVRPTFRSLPLRRAVGFLSTFPRQSNSNFLPPLFFLQRTGVCCSSTLALPSPPAHGDMADPLCWCTFMEGLHPFFPGMLKVQWGVRVRTSRHLSPSTCWQREQKRQGLHRPAITRGGGFNISSQEHDQKTGMAFLPATSLVFSHPCRNCNGRILEHTPIPFPSPSGVRLWSRRLHVCNLSGDRSGSTDPYHHFLGPDNPQQSSIAWDDQSRWTPLPHQDSPSGLARQVHTTGRINLE